MRQSRFHFTMAAAAAALALGCGAAAAQSAVQVYGQIDVSGGSFKAPGGDRVTKLASGTLSGSYLGFKGSEDLGGGLSAIFAMESFFQADTGASARTIPGDPFWSRSSWVGLRGGFGQFRMGRITTPLAVSTFLFNPLGDSFDFSPMVRTFFGATGKVAGDTGWNDSFAYASPSFGGATLNVQYSPKTAPNGSNIGASLMYFGGPLALTAVAQEVGSPFATGKERTYQLGATYDFGVAKVYALVGRVEEGGTGKPTADTRDNLYNLAARVPAGPGSVVVGYGQSKTSGALQGKREHTLIGYDYGLSKRTNVYLFALSDKLAGTGTGSSIALGIKHNF